MFFGLGRLFPNLGNNMQRLLYIGFAFNLAKGEVQNCKIFIGKEQMKHVPITYDIWCRSVCALHKSLLVQGVKNTLHLLSTKELKKVKNIHGKYIWGKGKGYCGENTRNCMCKLESYLSCVTLRHIMHVP
jgi:hypothetical protein